MMRVLKSIFLISTLTLWWLNITLARTGQQTQTGKCVIAGRVVVGETPVRDATVIATFEDSDSRRRSMSRQFPEQFTFMAKTDTEGRYRIVDLKSGIYQVQVFAPAMVIAEKPEDANLMMAGMRGKRVTLADDEILEEINFSLLRGGVITGRVTVADGRPIIAEVISLTLETKKEYGIVTFPNDGEHFFITDDRGIYRIYGIPDGRYRVSVGNDGWGLSANRAKGEKHKKTFYPGVTDEAAAEWIEIKNGNEVRDADIKIGAGEKTYTVAGRVVDADTGKGLSDFNVALDTLHKDKSRTTNWSRANSKGEFKIEGTISGSYTVYANEIAPPKHYYSEATRFEVNGANVSDIEIKVHRGLTVSGVAVIEGTTDPTTFSELARFMVVASSSRLQKDVENDFGVSNSAVAQIGADGRFALSGLRPGQLQISARNFSHPSNLAFIRLERNDLDVTKGFEVKAGEPVTDLRVVLIQANGEIRGQVIIEGGKLIKNQEIWVEAVRLAGNEDLSSQTKYYSARLDGNNRFVMEGLIAGEYELTIDERVILDGKNDNRDNEDDDKQPDGSVYLTAKQRVTVMNGQQAEVTLMLKAERKNN